MTECEELHDVAYRLLESHTIFNTASLLGVSRMTIQHWREMAPQHTRKGKYKQTGWTSLKLTKYLAQRLRHWVTEVPSQTLNYLQQHTRTLMPVFI